MSYLIVLLDFMFCFSILVSPLHINLDLTEWTSENENNPIIQHHCLHIPGWPSGHDIQEIISYCLSEWPSKWNIQNNSLYDVFSFAKLSHLNITTQQLYLWSAPMDIIEDYQIYLNQPSTTQQTLMSTGLFYNCTLPTFGPMCQFSFNNYRSDHKSVQNIIYDHYLNNRFLVKNQTCYTHLQCDMGETLLCISWENICDGSINCINGLDEEHCWELETNQCKDNEFRCKNGQCIALSFLKDDSRTADCLDGSDENSPPFVKYENPIGPPFRYEDIVCFYVNYIRPGSPLVPCHDNYAVHFPMFLFLDKAEPMIDNCRLSILCYLSLFVIPEMNCDDMCLGDTCKEKIEANCPDTLFYMPNAPVVYGHIYFAYTKEYIIKKRTMKPEYICYNEQLCGAFYPDRKTILFNKTTCRRPEDFPLPPYDDSGFFLYSEYVFLLHSALSQCNTIVRNDSSFCNKSIMYQCVNSSKCIAKVRLYDGVIDCDYKDDESLLLMNEADSIVSGTTHIKCTQQNKLLSRKLVEDNICNCGYDIYEICDDEYSDMNYIREHISFPTICDGLSDLKPVLIDGKNETDETDCEQWLCNNTYTRCNGIWDCLNGADEVGCYPSLMNCPPNNHVCFSAVEGNYMCLSLNKTNDGHIDCLGATDERQYCAIDGYLPNRDRFFCKTQSGSECISSVALCNKFKYCLNGDDEKFCGNISSFDSLHTFSYCDGDANRILSDVDEFLCDLFVRDIQPQIKHFSLKTDIKRNIDTPNYNTNMISTHYSTSVISPQNAPHCHRSIDLRVWFDREHDNSTITCLCSSNYYGDQCKYQNQRVSFITRFRAYADSWQTPFIVIVTLIDNSHERIIHSYKQFTYIPVPNCKTKYITDLLYATRPKNQSKQYSVHIDVYEKITLSYRGSLLIPLSFPFLPIERIATVLDIPPTTDNFQSCSNHNCIHGRCIRYFNDPNNINFCQCEHGWSGQDCTISHVCSCSLDSLCLGILPNNRSLCVCPMNKWGSRCYIYDHICQSNNLCQHGGQCIPIDQSFVTDKPFECICPKGYFGEKCEIQSSEIILSFNNEIDVPQSMFVHFIEVKDKTTPEKGSTLKTMPVERDQITIYWSRPFHIAFLEFHANIYYLIHAKNTYNQSDTIRKTLGPIDRCVHIQEVLPETIAKSHLLRRIKHYHVPCEQQPFLSCFYDDDHFCLCTKFGEQRQVNCFEYNHTLKYDCLGQSVCENGAQCLQDSSTCPTTSLCVCPTCFYGTRCQFSSSGLSLSLDAILGYHIQPHLSIHHQPAIVKTSVALVTIIIFVGLVNGILSIITFVNKDARKTGCGFYLIGSSITTFCTSLFFALKFSILINAQIKYMTNRSFLWFQCGSIDYLLRISLNMDQWLNACISMERVVAAIMGISFNKIKSIKIAKYVIPALFIVISSTFIHDPYYRRVIDDDSNDEKRIWCIVTYPSQVQTFDIIVNIFHFIVPFLINLASAVIIIIKTARLRTTLKKDQTYKEHLREQLEKHKHLLIASILLVVLAIPRLIISVTSGCLRSGGNSWLFLTGYLISFFPPIFVFIIHVLPSKTYTTEFTKTIQRYQRTIRARIYSQ